MTGRGMQIWAVAALNAIADDPTLTPHEKLVAFILARHCDARGVCHPGKRLLATKTGLDRRTVMRAIAGLEAKHRVDRVQRRREHDRNETNVYRVRMPMAGGVGVYTPPSGGPIDPRKDPSGRDLGSRAGSAAPVSSETPIRRASARRGSKTTGDPDLDRARAVLAGVTGQREVGPKLAGDEMHRLSQAMYAKDIAPALLVTAAEQYRDGRGPWSKWSTLRSGVTAILDDVEAWARASEPAPPRKQRAPKPLPPEPPSGVHRVADVTPLPDWLDRLDRRRKGGRG